MGRAKQLEQKNLAKLPVKKTKRAANNSMVVYYALFLGALGVAWLYAPAVLASLADRGMTDAVVDASSSPDAVSRSSSSGARNLDPIRAWVTAPHPHLDSLLSGGVSDLPTWGTYRPGVYFGLKQRIAPFFMATGIMWGNARSLKQHDLRHKTDPNELDEFTWLMHDGRSFGVHHMTDSHMGMVIEASALLEPRAGVAWAQRFEAESTSSSSSSTSSLIFYLGAECDDASVTDAQCMDYGDVRDLAVSEESEGMLAVTGHSQTTGAFKLVVHVRRKEASGEVSEADSAPSAPSIHYWAPSKLSTSSMVDVLKSKPPTRARDPRNKRKVETPDDPLDDEGSLQDVLFNDAGAVAVQIKWPGTDPVVVDVALLQDRGAEEHGLPEGTFVAAFEPEHLTEGLRDVKRSFNARFDRIFGLTAEKGFTEGDREVGVRALSAMLGGIGHFSGSPVLGDAAKDDGDRVLAEKAGPAALEAHVREQKKMHGRGLSMLTATPSRTAFPRGFLWDEGFHQLLISTWDEGITTKVLTDWMASMHFADAEAGADVDAEVQLGWIPREMILGKESSGRVPDEFVVQRPNVANPPTLLLVVEKLLLRVTGGTCTDGTDSRDGSDGNGGCAAGSAESLKFLGSLYPSLHSWVQWQLQTQAGEAPGSFRWRGRSLTDGKLAPNTLSSGLDDYPRGLFPSADEMHLDLLCWMATATRIMHMLGEALVAAAVAPPAGAGAGAVWGGYGALAEELRANVDKYHWSEEHGVYADVGLRQAGRGRIINTNLVRCAVASYDLQARPTGPEFVTDLAVPEDVVQAALDRAQAAGAQSITEVKGVCVGDYPLFLGMHSDGNRDAIKQRHVVSVDPAAPVEVGHVPHIGYESVFPLLLRTFPRDTDSDRFEALLRIVESRSLLWTDHGLRSMATTDTFYMQPNAEGDNPYWRGPIWVNANYLALSALHYYGSGAGTGPHQHHALRLYRDLRRNLMATVVGEFQRTGFFWEQYDDSTGEGMRNRPFSGWTALILNIMSEKY